MHKMKMKKTTNKTFGDGCQEYILHCKARNFREGTLRHYREASNGLYRIFPADTPIKNFNKNSIDEFILKFKERYTVKDITLFTYCRDLKTFLNYFMKMEYIEQFKISLPKVDKEPIETYTDWEITQLLKKPDMNKTKFANYRNWVIVNFLIATGIRLNSLINIKIKDLDFDNSVVYISTTKNRKPLILPLTDSIRTIIKEYLNYRQHESCDDYLFTNVFGEQISKTCLVQAIIAYNKSKGVLKTGVHRFRHTFAKKWITSGGNVAILKDILGHSSLDVTQNYINTLVSDLKVEMDKFSIIDQFTNKRLYMKK